MDMGVLAHICESLHNNCILHGSTNDDYCLLIRGTKVRKMHTSRRDAFRPINERPFGKIDINGMMEVINENYRRRSNSVPELDNKYNDKVAQIQVYPGQDQDIIDFYVEKGYKGLVLLATALGHISTQGKKRRSSFSQNQR